MSEPTPKLPGNADQLLQSFPANEPDFDAQAKAIQARIAAGSVGGAALHDLLKAPDLPGEAGEPALPSHVHAAPAPKSNFAEMARRSLQKKDDSAELAKELLAVTAQSRRPDAEMVQRVRAASRLSPVIGATGTPVPGSSRDALAGEVVAEDAPRASGVVARVGPAKPERTARVDRGTLVGLAGGLLAVAACVALFFKSTEADNNPTSAALAAEKAAPEPAATPQAAPGAPHTPAKKEDGVLSPEALAAAPETVPDTTKAPAQPAASPARPAGATSKAGAATSAAASAVVLEDDPEPAAAPAAVAEQQKEPLAPEPKLEPAEGNSGNVPLTPSGGAVSTAFSSVRGDAQACLAGQTDPVTATVTFASDGHVLRVNAAGPSGSCIQAALAKARIAPFARDSFTVTTTIRPR